MSLLSCSSLLTAQFTFCLQSLDEAGVVVVCFQHCSHPDFAPPSQLPKWKYHHRWRYYRNQKLGIKYLQIKTRYLQFATRYYILTTSPGYCCWCCTGTYNCTGTIESVRSTCWHASRHICIFLCSGMLNKGRVVAGQHTKKWSTWGDFGVAAAVAGVATAATVFWNQQWATESYFGKSCSTKNSHRVVIIGNTVQLNSL